jgi:hypothetical protein
VVFAAVAGLVVLLTSSPPAASRTPPEQLNLDHYDDSIGRMANPVSYAEFSHVLIGWEGLTGTRIKQPGRTKGEAHELVVEVWRKYLKDRTESNWRALQAQYNDDSEDPHYRYQTEGGPPIAPAMQQCAKTTSIGYARIVETPYGFHLMRREK